VTDDALRLGDALYRKSCLLVFLTQLFLWQMEDRLIELVQSIHGAKALIANEESLEAICRLLATKNIRNDMKYAILDAIFNNVNKFANAHLGRAIRTVFPLIDDDRGATFLTEAIRGCKSRVLNAGEAADSLFKMAHIPTWSKVFLHGALHTNSKAFPQAADKFNLPDRFEHGWRAELATFVFVADATAQNATTKLQDFTTDFVTEILAADKLIANEVSFETICSTLHFANVPCETKVDIIDALITNTSGSNGPEGRSVRVLFRFGGPLLYYQHLNRLVANCCGFIGYDDEVKFLLSQASCPSELKSSIIANLEANATLQSTRPEPAKMPDQFINWQAKFEEFITKVTTMEPERKDEDVPSCFEETAMKSPGRFCEVMEALALEQVPATTKVQLASRIVTLMIKDIAVEDVDMVRGTIIASLFVLLSPDQEIVEFITAEINKCNRLLVMKQTYLDVQTLIVQSKLTKEQQHQLAESLRLKYNKNAAVRSKYTRGLIETVTSGERRLVEFVVAEIAACGHLLMTVDDFTLFARRLETSRMDQYDKLRVLKAILANAEEFGE